MWHWIIGKKMEQEFHGISTSLVAKKTCTFILEWFCKEPFYLKFLVWFSCFFKLDLCVKCSMSNSHLNSGSSWCGSRVDIGVTVNRDELLQLGGYAMRFPHDSHVARNPNVSFAERSPGKTYEPHHQPTDDAIRIAHPSTPYAFAEILSSSSSQRREHLGVSIFSLEEA